MLKEIKHNKQKDILFSCIRRLNIIKNGHTTQSDPLIQFNTLFFFRELIPTQHDGIHLFNLSVYCLQITRHTRHLWAGIFFFLSCLSLDLQSLQECVVHRWTTSTWWMNEWMTMEMGATEMGNLKPGASALHLSIFSVTREKEKKTRTD